MYDRYYTNFLSLFYPECNSNRKKLSVGDPYIPKLPYKDPKD